MGFFNQILFFVEILVYQLKRMMMQRGKSSWPSANSAPYKGLIHDVSIFKKCVFFVYTDGYYAILVVL